MGRQTESGNGLPQGFDPPSSNVTWCPNQFFDVVLPHFPRGVVRLVGYLLWQTLAWNDEQGQPRRTRHRVNWKTLGARAQVSRGALSEAIRAALAAHLLRPEGSDSAGTLGRVLPETLELCWQQGPYTRSPADFRGFFMGRGHRTYVPNQFFTVVIARELLAVSRVVGAIARQSIGFEAEYGHRRTDVALSCKALARLTNLSITRVHFAVGVALERGYITQVEPGAIGRGDAQPALAARYALRWRDGGCGGIQAPPFQATKAAGPARSSKSDMAPVQKVEWPEFKKANGIEEEIKPLNETLAKPARAKVPAGALPAPGRRPARKGEAGDRAALEARLREVGFTGRSIAALAVFPRERIERQIAWLEDRTATRSSLGLLRRAIEEEPAARWDSCAARSRRTGRRRGRRGERRRRPASHRPRRLRCRPSRARRSDAPMARGCAGSWFPWSDRSPRGTGRSSSTASGSRPRSGTSIGTGPTTGSCAAGTARPH